MPRAPMPVCPARSPGNQGAPRGDTAAFTFLHKELGAKAGTPTILRKRTRLDGRTHIPSSHGDSGAQEHRRLRSSRRRGAAILRRDGQQPGKNPRRRVSTSRCITGKRDQGEEERKGAAVLTMGRWWSRGRLDEEACEGELGVHVGGRRLGSSSLSPASPRLSPFWHGSALPGSEVVLFPARSSASPSNGASRRRHAHSFSQRRGGTPAFSLNPGHTAV
jgi:hypothetical protein